MLGVKPPVRTLSHTMIDQPGQLKPLLDAMDRVKEISLDTEADNMYHYRTRICLMQIMVAEEIFLVDVLAPGMKLDELWTRLRRMHLVMHGSDFDLRLLHAHCGFRAHSLFDTMLAAQLLNRKRIGLAGLLDEHFGVELDKEGQKANWSRRPLPKKLLDYAAGDVFHLPQLRTLLTSELKRLGRLEWFHQQCRAQIAAGAEGFAPADDNDWRIGHSERLRGAGLGVLHAVWHWREDQARRLDTPPFKVCNNDLLLRLASAAEQGASEAEILASVNLGKRHSRLFGSLQSAVKHGLARDPKTLPRRQHQRHAPLSAEELSRQDALKALRDRQATKLDLDPTLIANRSQLAQLAREPRKIDELLLPWQADLLRDEPSLKT
ncbi:MAG: HRDC domain-containing protein [Opitutae bacterium]|nr:HRDC domain-containing protein [Opitutae bacterium]